MDPISLAAVGTMAASTASASATPLAVAGLASSALGTGVSLIGGLQKSGADAAAASYQAQVARNNQVIADQNARYATAAGAAQGQAHDMQTRSTLGAIEASQGASGLDLASPTSRRVRDSVEQLGQMDTATIIQNAMMKARSYTVQGIGYGAQAELDSLTASNARSAGTTGAFTSLLSGASSFSDKWLRYQNAGVSGFGTVI